MSSGSAGAGTAAPLLGRREELAELWDGLEDARQGRGRLFLLAGEGGIGKTRLLEALVEDTEPTEVRAVWGRCWEPRAAPPFSPWLQLVRDLVDQVAADSLVRCVGSGAPDVAHLVPELAERLPDISPAVTAVSPDARLRLFDSITDLLRNVGALGGLLVALDDLHAADEASLRLLLHAADGLATSNVVLVGTYRDAEVRSAPHLHHLVAAIARRGRRIVLSGLDERDVARLLGRITGERDESADPEWARQVHQTTDGNPFFVQEVAYFLPPDRTGPGAAVPEDVQSVILRRLETVDPAMRGILDVAAVIGPNFDLPVLRAAAGTDSVSLVDGLSEATRIHLLGEVESGRWSFRHELLREAIYDDIRVSRRVALHRRVGEALEQQYGQQDDSHVTELAHHFFEAARGGDGERARHYCTLAGEGAMAALAFEEAGIQYGRALEALALAPPVDEGQRYRLSMSLAKARSGLGDVAQAREFHRRAMKSARTLGSAELLAGAAIELVGVAGSTVDQTSVSVLEEARAALPAEDSPVLARVLVALAGVTANRRAGIELSKDALAMARRVGDPDALAAALRRWHEINDDPDKITERLAVADELIRLSLDEGDGEGVQLARQWRVGDLFMAGDIPAMTVAVEFAIREAEKLRLPSLTRGALVQGATLALLQGRLDAAERLGQEARAAGERGRFADADTASFYLLYPLRREQGRFEEMAELARRRLELSHHATAAVDRAHLALALAELGKSGEARDEIASVVAELLDSSGWARLTGPALVADVSWLTGELRWAEATYDRLLRWPGRHVVGGGLAFSLGASDRYLGQLATLLGHLDRAEEHFRTAHILHERLEAPGWSARGRVDHARMLLIRRHSGDEAQARRLVSEARDVYRALGMTEYEQRAAALVEDPVPGTGGGTPEKGTFSLEGEYWGIDYRGTQARLRDSKGLRYLARLLRTPGQEVHALDLVVSVGGTRTKISQGTAREAGLGVGTGDAGAILDAKAKAAYKRRVAELQEEIEEASAHHDVGRVDRAQQELDFLIAELSAAVGLGGRDRKAASDAERARQSVTRAIKGAVDRISEAHPALGEHLRTTVRTGTYSSYAPDPRAPIRWSSDTSPG